MTIDEQLERWRELGKEFHWKKPTMTDAFAAEIIRLRGELTKALAEVERLSRLITE